MFTRIELIAESTLKHMNGTRIKIFQESNLRNEPRYGRTRTTQFFSTVGLVSLTVCMLSINRLKHLKNFKDSRFLRKYTRTEKEPVSNERLTIFE